MLLYFKMKYDVIYSTSHFKRNLDNAVINTCNMYGYIYIFILQVWHI